MLSTIGGTLALEECTMQNLPKNTNNKSFILLLRHLLHAYRNRYPTVKKELVVSLELIFSIKELFQHKAIKFRVRDLINRDYLSCRFNNLDKMNNPFTWVLIAPCNYAFALANYAKIALKY